MTIKNEKVRLVIDIGDEYFPVKVYEAPKLVYDRIAKLLSQKTKVDLLKILIVAREKLDINFYRLQKIMEIKSYSNVHKHCQELKEAGVIDFEKILESGKEKIKVSLSDNIEIYSLSEYLKKNKKLFNEQNVVEAENSFISKLRLKMQMLNLGGL